MSPDELIEAHLPLARQIARRLAPRCRGIPLDDLESYAKLGLIRAARSWDATRSVPFPGYAWRGMRLALLEGIRQETKNGKRREESIDLDTASHADQNYFSDPAHDVGRTDHGIDVRGLHARLVARLTLREKRIVLMRYGDDLSIAEIAAAERIAEDRATRLIARALAVLRAEDAPDRDAKREQDTLRKRRQRERQRKAA